MSTQLGVAAVSVATLACAFVMLQLITLRQWRGLLANSAALAVGISVLATHGDGVNLAWLRNASWRGDAIALGTLIPLVAVVAGVAAAGNTRTTWATSSLLTASAATALAGFSAFWIDRGAWHWDAITIVAAGSSAAYGAGSSLVAPNASANRRIVFGCTSLAGCFLAVAGAVLFAASNAIV